ncbi:hypothetical protein WA158_007523 [Blastocystis sp. Blastoise]
MQDIADYKVRFCKDVEDYFIKTMGQEYYDTICSKACRSPSYDYDLEYTSQYLEILFLNEHGDMIIIPPRESKDISFEELKNLPLCIVDRKCGESVLRGSDIYVKGIRFITKPIETKQKVCIAVELPSELPPLPRGSDIQLYKGNMVVIGYGFTCMNHIDIFKNNSGKAIDNIFTRFFTFPSLNSLPSSCFLQNLPSYLIPYILLPKESDIILDMCASPGGKTTHISQIMKNKGIIIATDRSKNKLLSEVAENITNLNCKNIYIRSCDMSKCLLSEEDEECLRNHPDDFQIKDSVVQFDTSSVRYKKKLIRIYKQKLRRKNDKVSVTDAKADQKNDQDIDINEEELEEFIKQKVNTTNEYIEDNNMTLSKEQSILSLYPYPSSSSPTPLSILINKAQTNGSIKVPGFPRESFDRILLDPPCSALGLRPRLCHDTTLQELEGTSNYQKRFIDNAIALLKVGGILVYSTCTINPMENEENVKYILEKYPMELLEAPAEIYEYSQKGIEGILSPENTKKVIRFSMNDKYDSNGFFAAKFKKVKSL